MPILTQCMRDALLRYGHEPVVINLAAPALGQGVFQRAGRLLTVSRKFLSFSYLLLMRRVGTVYLAVSGGLGQLYDVAFLLVARVCHARVFLHHHSYAYIDRQRLVARLLTAAAGRSAVHFVGCEHQGRTLEGYYPHVRRVRVLSNAALIEHLVPREAAPRPRLNTVGFLGNISLAKGILEFLEVIAALRRGSVNLRALIAGPFAEPRARAVVLSKVRTLEGVSYVGPRYGPEKRAFYSEIDALLFPTRYANETAPVTIYEALASSVPVIAWERGCIRSIIENDGGLVVPRDADYVSAAVAQIVDWAAAPETFARASANAYRRFIHMANRARPDLAHALSSLTTSG